MYIANYTPHNTEQRKSIKLNHTVLKLFLYNYISVNVYMTEIHQLLEFLHKMTLAPLSMTVGVVECIRDDVDLSSELKYRVFWTRKCRLCVCVCVRVCMCVCVRI